MTFVHAFTKSVKNLSSESEHAYNSASALNSELDPKIKSTLVLNINGKLDFDQFCEK